MLLPDADASAMRTPACFDEDRFESYRALGYHSNMAAAGELEQADAWHFCAAVARKASAEASFAPR